MDWSVAGGIVAGIVSIVAVVMQYRHMQLVHRFDRIAKELAEAKSFISTVVQNKEIYTDTILIGPSFAGKTTLMSELTKMWNDNSNVRKTPYFETHILRFPEYQQADSDDFVSGVRLVEHRRAAIRVYDYGGEQHIFPQALRQIENLESCVIIMVINTDPTMANQNLSYYSPRFVKELSFTLSGSKGGRIIDVIVVLSKIDLILNNEAEVGALQDKFDDCIHSIKRVFGDSVEFIPLSSVDGRGLPLLVKRLSRHAIDSDGKPIRREL